MRSYLLQAGGGRYKKTDSIRKKNSHKDGLLVWLICTTILSTGLPTTALANEFPQESSQPFVIKDILEQVHETLGLSSELQPVVDLIQIVKRPLTISSAILQVQNASRLAFGEATNDIKSTLFFMLGHKNGLYDPFSMILVDISLKYVVAVNPSTKEIELKPFQGPRDPNIHFLTKGARKNCNIKLKEQEPNQQLKELKIKVQESGEMVMSENSKTYFQIRKLGSTMLK